MAKIITTTPSFNVGVVAHVWQILDLLLQVYLKVPNKDNIQWLHEKN